MGFNEGQIILDSDVGYFAGQTAYGRVVFNQDKVKTIHGIYADMKGFCKVHWTTQESRRVNNRTQFHTVSHDAHEEYFHRKTFIFGDDNGEHHLQPGRHEFRFECPIPANCPSTFEGTYGHVRYRVKVVMVTTGIFSLNKEKMVPIRVHAPLDLNQNPYCKEPIEYELLSSYCCWCVSAGSSEVLVRLPVGGYCPGQVIPMEVKCKNPSSVDIDKIKFAIKKDVTFTATSIAGTRYEHDTVAEISKGPIPAGTTRNWTVDMEVPTMDLYNVDACRFIDITYTFKVSTEADNCHDGTEDVRPIIFGTIPLVGYQDNFQNPLHGQLPKPIGMQNVPAVNCYPPPPIMSQPLTNSPYPNGNGPYPNESPYPTANPPYPTPPSAHHPYSPGQLPNMSPYPSNPPYPVTPSLDRKPPVTTSPYPSAAFPYPGANPPYTVTSNQGTSPPYPVTNSINPGANPPYPATSPNPGANPPYPATSPNPGANPPYPATSPNPGANSPYPATSPNPGANPPYPATSPNPGANPPYPASSPNPGANPPYPASSPNPGANPPYPVTSPGANPVSNSPYPPATSPYNTDFSSPKPTSLKTGTIGFTVSPLQKSGDPASVPLLPAGANVPYPTSPYVNPYASASAPEPSTPGSDQKMLEDLPEANVNSNYPPNNPEFTSEKNEKPN